MHTKEKEIYPADILKIKWNCQKQIILLMTPNKEKEGLWHYLAVKNVYVIKRNNIKTSIAWIALILLEQKISLGLMK